jgi:hypothetical protein
VDSTLFTRKMGTDLFVCQIYVDDIIFCSTNASFCEEFSKIMINRFEMSMMGELKYFLVFKSSNWKMEHSEAKPNTLMTYSRRLAWTGLSPSRLSWAVSWLIKRYNALSLVLCFTFVHLGQILCLVCVYVQDFKPHPRNAI